MACWFLQSHDHTRRGTSYFNWLEHCRDHKCTEKWRNLFGTIGPICWPSEPSVEQDDSNMLQIEEGFFSASVVRRWKGFLRLGVGDWRWKFVWCYSSGNVICNFSGFSTELFPNYTTLTLIFIFSISFFSLDKFVLD